MRLTRFKIMTFGAIGAALAILLAGLTDTRVSRAADPLLPKPRPIASAAASGALLAPEPQASGKASGQGSDMKNAATAAAQIAPYRPAPMRTDLKPKPRLGDRDAARYARIFFLQENGAFAKADADIAQLENGLLIGHVYRQRLLHKNYRATYAELRIWLEKFGDHPDAQKIYALANARRGEKDPPPARPRAGAGVARGIYEVVAMPSAYDLYRQKSPYVRKNTQQRKDLNDKIRAHLKNNAPTKALGVLQTADAKKVFDTVAYDQLMGEIASQYYYLGYKQKAYHLAAQAAVRSRGFAPLACWIAGLTAFSDGKYTTAATYFEYLGESKQATPWMTGAGAYWAARAHFQAQNPDKVSYWLYRAADYPRTFYGLIAVKTLGLHQVKYNWKAPAFNDSARNALRENAAGRRAVALIDAGARDFAELELLTIDPKDDMDLRNALIAVSDAEGMPALAMRFGNTFRRTDGTLYDSLLYPVPPWMPKGGFKLDPALVYAFIRQESKFNPHALSSSGARGLMQLMPNTAIYLSEKHDAVLADAATKEGLADPEVNMGVGQAYLAELLNDKAIAGDLFKLASAYNAGPGRLQKWISENENGFVRDPLLFIESIPSPETRIFVERVLTNYWIYRIRMGKETQSLDNVAAGGWPIYEGKAP